MSKILIITNHSYMLYRFRLELIQELMKTYEVVLSIPFVGDWQCTFSLIKYLRGF